MIETNYRSYVKRLIKSIQSQEYLASQARKELIDPSANVESIITTSTKSKISTILDVPKLEEYLPSTQDLHEKPILLAADIAKQIVNGRFVEKSRDELILLAIQSSLVILSHGLISVPEEAIPRLSINKKTNHLTLYFSNTIRYVKGETIGLVIMIADYIRHVLHLNRFSATPEIMGRYIEEMELYLSLNDRDNYIQRKILEDFIQNVGVEISGESYDRLEVVKYRNLPQLTNQLRTGMCVALDKIMGNLNAIAQKRQKSGIPEWSWLKTNFQLLIHNKHEFGSKEIRATQPLISMSKKPGGFRLRYGRTRNTGHGVAGIHPVTMSLLEILTPGTCIKTDLMDRTLSISPVSCINGPLIELNNGRFLRIKTLSDLKKIKDKITTIWELGDILISPEDIPERETFEIPSWTEEWWALSVKKANSTKYGSLRNLANLLDINITTLERILEKPLIEELSLDLIIKISKFTQVPLHPRLSFNWNEIAISDLLLLLEHINSSNNGLLPNINDVKLVLKRLGVPFEPKGKYLLSDLFTPFIKLLKDKLTDFNKLVQKKTELLEIEYLLNELLNLPIRSYCQRRLGVKIVRNEKSEERFLNPPAHVIFPVGTYGGTQRNILKLSREESVKIHLSNRFCPSCKEITYESFCPSCKNKTIQHYTCKNGHLFEERTCPECGKFGMVSTLQNVDFSSLINENFKKTKITSLDKLKGVSYLVSKHRIPENLAKGMLRAKYNLFVYKDGTLRFDLTNASLSHFKPKEIGTTIEELRHLGYSHDIFGNDLTDENQTIELYPYDVIISQSAENFLINLSNFLDDELTLLYKQPPYYRINSARDIVGSLIVGLSPFSKVAIVGRIIGFTNSNIMYAHPIWHKLKTRNCNGDVDSFTLLLDVFLNFSEEFIPASRGGYMDIPLILNIIEDWDDVNHYAQQEFYPLNLPFFKNISKIPSTNKVITYKTSLLEPLKDKYYFTDFISLPKIANPFQQSKIIDKVEIELSILKKLHGVRTQEFVELILENDFLDKISASIDKFFSQPFKCRRCNFTFRRIPLTKTCPNCNHDTISLTLSEGWVLRYLQIIRQLKSPYEKYLSDYLKSWIDLIELYNKTLFDKGPRTTTLFDKTLISKDN
ncbi:MAG: DNA polymerase II large subunit [Candidatus Hodarchaeales archaeon]